MATLLAVFAILVLGGLFLAAPRLVAAWDQRFTRRSARRLRRSFGALGGLEPTAVAGVVAMFAASDAVLDALMGFPRHRTRAQVAVALYALGEGQVSHRVEPEVARTCQLFFGAHVRLKADVTLGSLEAATESVLTLLGDPELLSAFEVLAPNWSGTLAELLEVSAEFAA